MTTQTQTLKRGYQASRTHDYLYDPLHFLASERDHARATFKSHTSTDRVKRVAEYRTMFSELKHHPRFQIRLDVTDPVPTFISRQWQGYGDQNREALIRYTTFNYDPSVRVPEKCFPNAEVTGKNRYKYAKRPMIPFLQQIPPDVQLASSRQDPLQAAAQVTLERPPTPLHKTIETQTDYRDSEAQTDPYTPEYVVRPGEAPELLTLATLSFGRGLPAGQAEVEMIERARAKRAWEATLPPLSDTSQLEKRKRMMDEMERKEWALREQEIEKLQESRLNMLKTLLKDREVDHQDLNIKRLDRLWSKKQKEKERKIKKIRNEHIKMIRKLKEKHKNVEGKYEARDIIKEYTNYDSQAYAPKTRIGVFLDRGSEQYVVKSRHLTTYQGLLELEASLPEFVIQPRIKAPNPKTVTKAGFIKRNFRQQRELMEMHEAIKEAKSRGVEPAKPLRFLQKIEKPVTRPPTPSVQVPYEDEEEREMAIIFLQQVIRGRAIQNMMFEGKEKRMELIKELRSTHALQEAEQIMKKQELQSTFALQRQRRLHEHKESLVDEALSNVEGGSIGDMIDFLSKELIRLQEERRIHAFSMLAERQRRIREAEESGRRQVEERRRREEDEIFKQVVKVHQSTVDSYLECVILDSVDETADSQARREIQEMADKINDIAYDIEDNRTQLDSEEIVADLVHCFALPEVRKMTARERVKISQRKYLLAAHKEILKEGDELIEMNAEVIEETEEKQPSGTSSEEKQVFGTTSEEKQISGTGSEEKQISGTGSEEKQISGTGSEEKQISGTGSEEKQISGTGSEEKQISGTGSEEKQISGTGSEEKQISGTGSEEKQISGTGSEEKQISGTGSEEKQISGSEEKQISGTGSEEKQISGTGSEEKQISGTGSEEKQISGTGSEEKQISGTGSEEKQISGTGSEEKQMDEEQPSETHIEEKQIFGTPSDETAEKQIEETAEIQIEETAEKQIEETAEETAEKQSDETAESKEDEQ